MDAHAVTGDRQTVSKPDEASQEGSGEEDGHPEALVPVVRHGTRMVRPETTALLMIGRGRRFG
jgi:hypothetical protein